MPTYEYRCPEGHEFELFQKMSDEPVATCPQCGEEAERLLSAGGGFVFKGEGFYITDYKRKEEARKAGKKPGEKAEPAASDTPDGGTTSGSGGSSDSSTASSSED